MLVVPSFCGSGHCGSSTYCTESCGSGTCDSGTCWSGTFGSGTCCVVPVLVVPVSNFTVALVCGPSHKNSNKQHCFIESFSNHSG